MKTFLAIALCTLGSLELAAQQRPIGFNDLMSMRRVGTPELSRDGKWIAYDLSEVDLGANKRRSAIYLMPASGGAAQKVTEGKTQDDTPSWTPDGKSLAYLSNAHGGAKQLYFYDIAAKTSRKVTDLSNGVGTYMFVPGQNAIVAVSDVYEDCGVDPDCTKARSEAEEKSPVKARVIDSLLYRHWNAWQPTTRAHLLYVPLGSGKARNLTPGKFDAQPFSVGGSDSLDVSPDGKEIAYSANTDTDSALSTNTDLFIVPTSGGEPKRITSRKGADDNPKYSPDGKWIAFRSQARAGYESDLWEIHLYNRASGEMKRLARSYNNYAESLLWSQDSKSLIFTGGDEKNSSIRELDVASDRVTKIYGNGVADAVELSRDGKTLYFQRSTLSQPAEIYSIARMNGRGAATQLTHENDARLKELVLGEVSDLWYEGAGGTRVQALMVKPPNFDYTKKYPAIFLIHGGPQGAWNDSWGYRWNAQMFAAGGYVVMMPNPRGSTGYGQKFTEEISGDWAGKVYTDLMNGVDRLAAMPFVDGSRIGAAGGSYGGYMVNWILGHSDRFKTLVSHAGVYNLESMYGVTEELWFTEWEFKGNPWDNPEQYTKWSPHRFAKNFKTPTLVIHGELDYRVPVGEGMQLFTALQRRGVPSKFLYFPDEGHWISKPQNSQLWYSTVQGWFDRFLK